MENRDLLSVCSDEADKIVFSVKSLFSSLSWTEVGEDEVNFSLSRSLSLIISSMAFSSSDTSGVTLRSLSVSSISNSVEDSSLLSSFAVCL